MPEKIVRFYDAMDSMENYDYCFMTEAELKANQDMYYELVAQEFPDAEI